MAAGSLLGVAVNKGEKEQEEDESTSIVENEAEEDFSYPVGKVDELTLYQKYLVVGGMPESVKIFVETHSFIECRTVGKREQEVSV